MPTANEYLKMAEECYRLACEAKTETDRVACIDLARTWLDAASRQHHEALKQVLQSSKG